jgi:hypothetical protein
LVLQRGVKGVRATPNSSFDSKLPATEEAALEETDPKQKAQGKAILQNAIYGYYGAVYEQNSQLLLRSSKLAKNVDWPTGNAWKT